MSDIWTAIRAADEEYLVALSSKGLYKRAVRELPDCGVALTAEGDGLTATFGDGTTLTMEGSIRGYKCSCPSRSVCRHLLLAVLAAKELGGPAEADGSEATAAEPSPPDFSPLVDMTAKALEKLAGKKLLRAAVVAVQLGETAEIEEGSTLAVTLHDSGHTVRFLPGAPPEEAGCTCKAGGFCAHKAQAVAQYIAHKKGGLPAEFLPADEEDDPAFSEAALPYIHAFAVEVLSTGLARLPEDAAGRFLQLATICHGGRLANPERLCRRIAGQLTHLAARSATFNRDALLGDLCQLLHLCERMEAGDVSRETVGLFRDTYRPVAAMELWGLGAWGWRSTGGYTGVSTLFFHREEGEVLTFTSAMPDTASTAEKLYGSGAPWGLPTKLSAIGHSRLALKGGKLSGRGQLSASESGQATPLGGVDIHDPGLAPIRFDSFDALLEALWRRMEGGDDSPMAAIVLPARTGAGDYDKIDQRWTLPLYDSAERRLILSVRYEPATRLLLGNLLELEEKDDLAHPLLVRASISRGRLTAFPVTLYGSAPFNLSLDRPKKPAARKRIFDWFK